MLRKWSALILFSLAGAFAQAEGGLTLIKGTKWVYKVQKDEMTGDNTSYALTVTDGEPNAYLMLACGDKRLDVLYYTDSPMNSFGRPMFYKFDNQKVVGPFEYVPMTFGDDALAALPQSEKTKFLEKMKTAKTVMLRTYDALDRQKTYTFSLPGAYKALTVIGNCK